MTYLAARGQGVRPPVSHRVSPPEGTYEVDKEYDTRYLICNPKPPNFFRTWRWWRVHGSTCGGGVLFFPVERGVVLCGHTGLTAVPDDATAITLLRSDVNI